MMRSWMILAWFGLAVSLGCNSTAGGGAGSGSDTENGAGMGDADDQASLDGGDAGAGGADADCAELTYENFAQDFFSSYCARCHSSELSGADRNGAPVGRDWDQLEVIRQFPDSIRNRTFEQANMPTSAPFPSDEERQQLADWIDCGAP